MSKIQWTQQTWNPIIGCSKISEGCANCYAEKTAARLARIEKTAYYGEVVAACGHWNGNTILVESQLDKPLKRKKPTIYFVGSMTDLFHESTPFEWLDEIFAVMALCSHHRFILLTKREERMQEYCSSRRENMRQNFVSRLPASVVTEMGRRNMDRPVWPLPNVILGVTAENQEQANKRIPILLETPAAARFVSIEPMLGAVDLTEIAMWNGTRESVLDRECWGDCACGLTKLGDEPGCKRNGGDGKLANLDWVICGGESGPGARPMHPDWVRSLRDQCTESGVPFFFKQWGEWAADGQTLSDGTIVHASPITEKWDIFEDGQRIYRVGKKAAGNVLDGQQHEEYPDILREVQDV